MPAVYKFQDTLADTMTGKPLRDVTISVVDHNTGLPATLYTEAGEVSGVPVVTDLDGYFSFYAELSEVDIKIPGGETVKTLTDVLVGGIPGAPGPASSGYTLVSSYASLAAAVAAIGAGNVTLGMAENATVSAPLAIPANIELLPINGAVINHGAYTISYAGSTARWPDTQIFNGTGAVTLSGAVFIRPDWFGTGNGTVAKANAAAAAGMTIKLKRRAYIEPSTIAVTQKNITIEGESHDRSNLAGSQIQFTGTGACIELGSDNSQPWDGNYYDGVSGLKLKNVNIKHTAPDTPLASRPTENYKAEGYGVRDWRGGSITLENVQIENFEYNFWGVQSDINHMSNVTSLYSRYGLYLGPRSDQNTLDQFYSFFCDNAIVVDGATGTRINNPQFVGCGSATHHAVLVRQGSGLVTINEPWLEHYQGYDGVDQIAFFGLGTEAGYGSDTAAVKGVRIKSPVILTTGQGLAYHTKYLAEVGKAIDVHLKDPTMAPNLGVNNINSLIAFQAGTAYTNTESQVRVEVHNIWTAHIYVDNGTGAPEILAQLWGNDASQIRSGSGRLIVEKLGAATGAESLRLSQEGVAGAAFLVAPTYTGGQINRLKLRRSWQGDGAMPTTGTYEEGDIVWNMGINEAGTAGSKYVVLGWARANNGSNHVLNTDWFEMRVLTGN